MEPAYRRNLAHPSLRLSTCARTLLLNASPDICIRPGERERRWPMFHWRLPNVRRTSAIITVIGPPSSRLIPTPGWKEKAHYAFWKHVKSSGNSWHLGDKMTDPPWSMISDCDLIGRDETVAIIPNISNLRTCPSIYKGHHSLTILNHHLLRATSFTAHRPDGWLSQASPQSSR